MVERRPVMKRNCYCHGVMVIEAQLAPKAFWRQGFSTTVGCVSLKQNVKTAKLVFVQTKILNV